MGCSTCKSECGREDGCGTRKAEQKEILDELLVRLYPSRTFGEPDAGACFRQGVPEHEVRRHGRALSVLLKAPTYFRSGGEDDLCHFIYVLCLGRQPALLEVREEGLSMLPEEPSALGVRDRYLRVAFSQVARLAAVQEVAMELDLDQKGALAVLRELPRPGVFDAKLLKRFQKTVDYLLASEIQHLDMGLLDLPASQYGLLPGGYEAQYGTAPGLFNYLFQAEPVQTAAASYLPLGEPPVQAYASA